MAQVKLFKIDSDGVSVEHDGSADDVTFLSYTVTGGGPVLDGTGLDMNNQDISDIDNVSFNDSTTGTITITAGAFIQDDMMFQTRENIMTTAGAVLFPVVTDDADQLDAFRLPAIAGVPSATPADGGEGYLAWDSTNDDLYVWNGTAWDSLSTVDSAGKVCNEYTADEALAAVDALYISAADNVSKADVSAGGAASRVIGFAEASAIDTATVNVCSEGVLAGFTGLTAGARYFADPATAGAITTTTPVGTGNTIVQVGYAKSATELHIHIEQLGRRA